VNTDAGFECVPELVSAQGRLFVCALDIVRAQGRRFGGSSMDIAREQTCRLGARPWILRFHKDAFFWVHH
jgi:hypothetical protein